MFELKKESLEYENKSLRLPKELIERVQTLANENNMSFNKVVIQYIEYALNDMKDNS
ncbi:MAG: Arc family DNA-binding protein [Lachnospiraceae bacterium]|jgi:predicted DNA-binding protein|nr:Arc family DNA-binding protein [Lachnospiraceae bacterium]